MNRLNIILLMALLTFLGGCVLSREPFYTKESVIEMPILDGKWQEVDSHDKPKDGKPWELHGHKIITYGDPNGLPGTLDVTYFKIGGLIFADTIPSDNPGLNEFQAYHLIAGHIVSRIKIEDNRLTVSPLNFDGDWCNVFIKEHRLASCVVINEYKTFVTNASSKDWVAFLEKYGTDEGAFTENILVFIKKAGEE